MLKHQSPLTTKAWASLREDHQRLENQTIKQLFDQDQNRFNRFSTQFDQLFVDFSKNRLDDQAFQHLIAFAREMELPAGIESLFNGEAINETENRPVLHTALRDFSDTPIQVEGSNIKPDIRQVYSQIRNLTTKVTNGEWKGYSGQPIQNIVHIGIGGSHLGPEMVTTALRPFWQPGIRVHYLANVDGADNQEILKDLNPETTLFIIASKSFTTQETLTNAHTARSWFLEQGGNEDDIQNHFIAISANVEKAREFGISGDHVFPLWDWVGGRFSLWSAIGLPIALTIGYDHFESLLRGAYAMDRHFRETTLENNLPAILSLVSYWYNNFFGTQAEAILPYDEYLKDLPRHLQQVTMESNGKSVDRSGQPVDYATQPVIFGEPGTNSQHSFFQLLHQGTPFIPCDFLAPIERNNSQEHHPKLLANCLAQSKALMLGQSVDSVKSEMKKAGYDEASIQQLAPYKTFTGNRPSNTFLYQNLDPYTLGQIIALYEHKTFVQGHLWNIFSFDQWGVELGKSLAKTLLPDIHNQTIHPDHDPSTSGLLNVLNRNNAF